MNNLAEYGLAGGVIAASLAVGAFFFWRHTWLIDRITSRFQGKTPDENQEEKS